MKMENIYVFIEEIHRASRPPRLRAPAGDRALRARRRDSADAAARTLR